MVFFFIASDFCLAEEKTIQADISYCNNLSNDLHRRVFKKYNVLEFNIYNNEKENFVIGNDVYYYMNGKKYKVDNANGVYEKTKCHTIRRAVIWGIIGGGVLSWVTVPPSLASSIMINNNLKDSIEKNIYRGHSLYSHDSYQKYIFLPKNHKKADSLIFKMTNSTDNTTVQYKFKIESQKNKPEV